MNGWNEDKGWSDAFLPEIKQILGVYLIGEPNAEEDQLKNTDLIVLTMKPVRIACRIRRQEYFERYQNEFTIRCTRPSENKTELSKIIEGWGEYFFYGFGNEETRKLIKWTLADLKVFRLCFMRRLYGGYKNEEKSNKDGSSNFMYFSWCDFPSEFIVASGNGRKA